MDTGLRRPHRSRIRNALNYAGPVLSLSAAASDVLPPLKSALGGALWIVEAARGFEANQEDWGPLASYIEQLVQDIVKSVPAEGQQFILEEPATQLNFALSQIKSEIETSRTQSSRKRWLAFLKDRNKILDYKSRVDRAVVIFSTGIAIATHRALAEFRDLQVDAIAAGIEVRMIAAGTRDDVLVSLGRLERCISEQTPRGIATQPQEPWSMQWFLREIKPNPAQSVVLFA